MKYHLAFILTLSATIVYAQSVKKPLDHSTYDFWNTIHETKITNDGKWTTYRLQPGQGNPTVKLYNDTGKEVKSFDRAKRTNFSWDSDFLVFKIVAHFDSLKSMRRRKVEDEDLPKDTLAIYNLKSQELEKIPNVKSFILPKEWSGNLAYLLAPVKIPEDTTIADSLKVTPKLNNDENGYTLS